MLARYHFSSRFLKLIHENSRVRPCVLEHYASTRFSVNCSDHSGRSRNLFLRAFSLSPFFFVFPIVAGSRDGLPLELSLLVDAGYSVSCNTDVGDVSVAELEGPVDKPGTTIGT